LLNRQKFAQSGHPVGGVVDFPGKEVEGKMGETKVKNMAEKRIRGAFSVHCIPMA
jgi:hypothetical protein